MTIPTHTAVTHVMMVTEPFSMLREGDLVITDNKKIEWSFSFHGEYMCWVHDGRGWRYWRIRAEILIPLGEL